MSVTIAVPVFNAEKYVERCIDNIRKQTYAGKIEIIFVVDSATSDRTIEILRRSEYSDVKVVMQSDNYHQSGAKNIALDHSNCKYIWFLDVDDWVSPSFLEEMVTLCEENNCDSASCNHYYSSECSLIVPVDCEYRSTIMSGDEACKALFEGHIPIPSWCKLFKVEMLRQNNVYFNTKRYSEDYEHSIRAFMCSKTVVYWNKPLYTYYLHEGSCSIGVGDDITKRDIEITQEILDEVKARDMQAYEMYCTSSVKHLLHSLTNMSFKGAIGIRKHTIFKECLKYKQEKFNIEITLFKISSILYYLVGRIARKVKFSKNKLIFEKVSN